MAQIIEENIVIRVSRLARDGGESSGVVTAEMLQALEQVAQELVGEAAIVEVAAA